MAKAPLSQTLFLTEDGSTIAVTTQNAVTIPPLVLPTIETALASSTRQVSRVTGAVELFDGFYDRAAAISARAASLRARRLVLNNRIAALES